MNELEESEEWLREGVRRELIRLTGVADPLAELPRLRAENERWKVWAGVQVKLLDSFSTQIGELNKERDALSAENERLRAEIAAEDAAHAWVQDAPQPETMCNYPSCTDEGCPCQYWRGPQ